MIGKFTRPYLIVPPTKFKRLFFPLGFMACTYHTLAINPKGEIHGS